MTRNKKINRLFVVISLLCSFGFLLGDDKNPIHNVMMALEKSAVDKTQQSDTLKMRRSRSKSM